MDVHITAQRITLHRLRSHYYCYNFSLSDPPTPQDMLIVHTSGFLGPDPETLFLSSMWEKFSGAQAVGMRSQAIGSVRLGTASPAVLSTARKTLDTLRISFLLWFCCL